jgi:hypothetical protein
MNIPTTNTAPPGLPDIIGRAAADPSIDIDKLQRLLDMQEAGEIRAADKAFSQALTAAEAEMETINTNARNDQTRSKYATFAQVDKEVRPIYTKHGFAISFTSEKTGTPGSILVVGTLSHRAGASRRYELPMPITTSGFKGQAMMTETHATMAAITYGRRNLEVMMFNLQIGDDTDGNAPRRPPTVLGVNQAATTREQVDPQTGEVTTTTAAAEPMEHQTPGMIEWLADDNWASWGYRFLAHLRTAKSADEVQQWEDLNKSTLDMMSTDKPASRANLRASVTAFRKGFA